MADLAPTFLAEGHEIGRGGIAAALADVARGERATLLRWPGARLSPFAAAFVTAAFAALDGDQTVAAVSLAVPRVRPGTAISFTPIDDGNDATFLQTFAPAAVALTPDQAERMIAGLDRCDGDISAYLAATGRYLATPRTALAHDGRDDAAQQRMFPVGRRAWRIGAPDGALACYDARLEITAAAARLLGPALTGHDFTVDLWGERPSGAASGLLLSARPCRAPILSFALDLTPPEANLAAPVAGGFFALGDAADFGPMDAVRREALFRHATRFNAMDDYANQFLAPLRRLTGQGRR